MKAGIRNFEFSVQRGQYDALRPSDNPCQLLPGVDPGFCKGGLNIKVDL